VAETRDIAAIDILPATSVTVATVFTVCAHANLNETSFTAADIEDWASAAGSERGYMGSTSAIVARAAHQRKAQARPFTLRLDAARPAKLNEAAHERHTTPSK
jgi:hypothetical protein